MKAYPSYKESGVEWIGKIPKQWGVKSLKYVANIETGNTPPKADEDNYLDGKHLWVKPDELTGFIPIYDSKEKITDKGRELARVVPQGSVLVCCIGTIGKFGIAGIDLSTNQQINSVTFNESYLQNFGKYVIAAAGEEHVRQSNSVVVSILSKSRQANIAIPAPPLPEQQAIADFLDRKTAQIDTLIEKKQRQIDLLHEQRTALINHAVTKGQRKDHIYQGRNFAPWLFPLPTGWNRQALKYNSYMKGRIGYQNLRSEEYTEEGPYLVSSAHFKDGIIEWDKCNHVTKERFEMAPEIILQKDDVLFMKDGALMGKLAYVNDLPGEACLNSHLLLMRPLNGSYLPRFLYYVFTTDIFEAYMIQERTGTTFFGLSQESMGNFPISLPPIDEQKEICKYLDEQTQKTKTAIEKINDGIIALQEYRTALISEAVTGKIDVRKAETVHE